MSSVSDISSLITGTASLPTPVVAPVKSTAPLTTSAQAPVAEKSYTGPATVVSNPLARVQVTEFYDNSGNVVSQIPSATVLAYLENGLSTDGSPKASATA